MHGELVLPIIWSNKKRRLENLRILERAFLYSEQHFENFLKDIIPQQYIVSDEGTNCHSEVVIKYMHVGGREVNV